MNRAVKWVVWLGLSLVWGVAAAVAEDGEVARQIERLFSTVKPGAMRYGVCAGLQVPHHARKARRRPRRAGAGRSFAG